MPKKKSKTGKPQLHKELEGFEMSINEFGEIKSTMDIQKVNEFLNRHVDDKKFLERDDQDVIKEGKFIKKERKKSKD
ncbi:MAG: hypothetical protein SH857_13525 [Chitinophagales bacterium]|nr:hypothetical protein [Chitinophagales bacterium]